MIDKKRTRNYYIFALLKYVKGFRWYLISSIVSKLLEKITPLILMVFTSYLISMAIVGDKHAIIPTAVIIVVLILLSVFFSFLNIYVSHDMSYRILTKLRNQAYGVIDDISPAATIDNQSGDFISTIIHDIEFFEWFYAHILTEWIAVFIISLFSLVFMGLFSLWLPIIILPFIAVILLIPKISAKKADKQGGAIRSKAGKLNAEIIGGVQGLKEIISYRWQKHFLKKFNKAIDDYKEAEVIYSKRSSNEKRFIGVSIEISSLCTSICITLLVVNGVLAKEWLMPMYVLAFSIFAPMQEALALSTNYGFVYGAAKRVFDLLQLKSNVLDKGKKIESDILDFGENNKCTVTFENVKFSYNNDKQKNRSFILNNLDFKVKRGETVALVSTSGGGKTTTARLLQRFWDVDSGSIKINGIDICELKLESLRNLVTVVPQDVFLFNETINENLRLARKNATDDEIKMACHYARADIFIEKLPRGYETKIGERGMRLSGGEKQRIAIAQAFLKKSPILILDEASASLDSENERLINQAIDKLKAGRTTIIIAHRVSTIKNADRIVLIKDGRVHGNGMFTELMSENAYFRNLIDKRKSRCTY